MYNATFGYISGTDHAINMLSLDVVMPQKQMLENRKPN